MTNQFTRRAALSTTIAFAGVASLGLPAIAQAAVRLKKSNKKALKGVDKVVLGSVGFAFLTERKRQIKVGGGFRMGGASQATVQTNLAGLTAEDYLSAADSAYDAVVANLTSSGVEIEDNAELLQMLRDQKAQQPNGTEYSFPEGNKQYSKAVIYGAGAFGGYVPLPNWTPTQPGLRGIGSTGLLMAANKVSDLFSKQAKATGTPIIGLMIGVSPVRLESSFGSDWRVPTVFQDGGLVRTGSLSAETGLSSHPQLTRMDVFSARGRAGKVTMKDEIGIAGGIGSLQDVTSGVESTTQKIGNVLSVLGGSGRQSKTTRYQINADVPSYLAGVPELSGDVASALSQGLN